MMKSPKKVLITGGTGSLGRELVKAFAGEEYSVCFTYSSNKLLAEQLSASFNAEALEVTSELLAEPPEVDVLVNNAAINISRAETHLVTQPYWQETMDVNLTLPFQMCQAVLPQMIENRWGRIINISSIYGFTVCEGNLPYSVSKHGMRALTTTIALEYAKYGITSNEVCPSAFNSNLLTRIAKEKCGGSESGISQYMSECADELPTGRLPNPSDIVGICIFLASEGASFVNGQSIAVDGGLTVQ